jgi:hypothetical protein
LLFSLKKKGYVIYPKHQGKGGSFDVKFKVQWEEADSNELITTGQVLSEDSKNFEQQSKKFTDNKSQLARSYSVNSTIQKVKSYKNDNDNEKENEIIVSKNNFKLTPVKGFVPSSREHLVCLDIANTLGEQAMNPLFKLLQTHGIGKLETAFGLYKEDIRSGKKIEKPGAYFTGLINNMQ